MSQVLDVIDDGLAEFVRAQRLFFVATAPGEGGHINVSPKGADSFRILGPRAAAYLDMTGSGIETIAHLRDNGRIVVMFCAFEGAPRILRLYGTGTVHERGSPGYAALEAQFTPLPGARAIIDIAVTRVATSCGMAVPLYDFKEERDQLTRWAEAKGEEALVEYRVARNAESIDGLPGFKGEEPAP